MALVIAVLALGTGLAYAQQDEGPILRPKTPPVKPSLPTLMVTCDLACNWTLDGAAKGRLDAGASVKVKVAAGQHTVAAETEDALDKAKNQVKVKAAGETIAHIWLNPVREARLQAEQEAKAKAEQEARDKAAREAQAKADQEAKDKAAQAARIKAAQDAQAKADKDAREKAFIGARDKASQEAQAKAEREAHDKAVRDDWNREQRERARTAQQDHSGGVWTDPATGLMWTRTDNGYALRWQSAMEYCRSLQLGGFSDWQLPAIDELRKIYNPDAVTPCGAQGYMSCQIRGNIHLSSGVVWSRSGGDEPQTMRGFIFRDNGMQNKHVVELDKRGNNYDRALCVRRSGQQY
jgi:hypothetical protein